MFLKIPSIWLRQKISWNWKTRDRHGYSDGIVLALSINAAVDQCGPVSSCVLMDCADRYRSSMAVSPTSILTKSNFSRTDCPARFVFSTNTFMRGFATEIYADAIGASSVAGGDLEKYCDTIKYKNIIVL